MKKLLLTTTIIALALSGSANAEVNTANVLFILDGSGSMWGQVEGKPKIEIARTVMGNMVSQLSNDARIGLISYGHNRKDDCNDIELIAPVGSDVDFLIKALNSVQPKGKTPLTDAIQQAAMEFRQAEGNASLVVVSDGKETCEGDPCAAARAAHEAGLNLRIHVIGFDVTEEETEQLTCIAKEGGGKYYSVSNTEDLTIALAEVEEQVIAPKPIQVAQAATTVSDVLFEDHFDRADLGEMWEVINHDPNRMGMSDGKLLIVAGPGRFDETPQNIVLLRQQFSDNFILTAKMTMQVTKDNSGGLVYYLDDENRLHFHIFGVTGRSGARTRTQGRLVMFSKRLGGEWNHINKFYEGSYLGSVGERSLQGYATTSEDWFYQLERSGLKYTARISVDGEKWFEVGSHTLISKMGRLGFSVFAGNGAENPAEFDDFVVKHK